jgi:hypothetical protein
MVILRLNLDLKFLGFFDKEVSLSVVEVPKSFPDKDLRGYAVV